MELLTVILPRVFATLTPAKIVELFKLGEGKPPKLGARTSEVVEGFYSFLGFTRLMAGTVIRKAIARGVQDGVFGYIAGAVPEIGADGRYQVPTTKMRFAAVVAEDEIDLESGFLIMPQAIPQPASTHVLGVATSAGTAPTADAIPIPVPGGVPTTLLPPSGAALQKVVEISFSADRNQLFTAWNAIANLADQAGKVSVTLRAETEKGFDRTKLQNGVIEPLREADLIE